MVILHARLVVKPEARERWFELVAALISPSRDEDACRSYDLYEAVDTPNTFVFVEQWESLEGLYAHFHTPHFAEFGAALGDVLVEAPVGTVNEVSSTMSLDEAFAAAGIG